MADDPWQDVPIALRWPGEKKGPWRIEVRFHRGEQWQATGLSLDLLDPASGRALQTSDLRELRLPRDRGPCLREARAAARG